VFENISRRLKPALVDEDAKMLKTLAYATLFSTALAGSAGFAQQSPGGTENSAAPMKQEPMKQDQAKAGQAGATNTQAPSGISFVTTQKETQWRAPKLIGVEVFGPDGKQIGKIDDILMDHDGAAQTVVIGIGGFLGFGKKDVAVPFSAIQWKTEPRKVPVTENTSTNPAASTQPAGPPPMTETNPTVTQAIQGYPDKAILNVTLAQLKGAPDFKYAESTLAASETRPVGGGEQMKKTTP
jgi:sporulation protein YlmC with PRC-barrel domain